MLESASAALTDAGANITELNLPSENDFDRLHKTIAGWEFARTVAWERLNRHDQLSDDLRDGRMQNGVDTSYDQYRKATADLEVLKLKVDAILADHDAVLCPSAPGEALKGHAFTGSAIFNGLWTMLGVPSVTLPVQSGPQGLPMGIQLVSVRNSDRKLFDVAQSISTRLRNL